MTEAEGVEVRRRRRDGPPRVAVYTHDTFGMGHVRRALNIIDRLASLRPDAAILLVTGCPALGAFGTLPPNVDVVKLPTIAPTGDAPDRPSHLPLALPEVIRLRRKTIERLLTTLEPDVLLVDNFALGARKELAPTLERLSASGRTRIMLGLRDIVDAPEVVRTRWRKDGILDALERFYDDVLVFGRREVFDVAEAYDLPAAVTGRVRYCGHVARRSAPADDAALASVGVRAPFILATVGGGGDGLPLLRAFFGARRALADMPALVVTGPLMGPGPRAEVAELSAEVPDVTVVDHLGDLPAFMARAELVVAMGGYNTVAEMVRNGCRSVIAPRDWRYGQHAKGAAAGVEMEQRLRAETLAAAGLAEVVAPDSLDPKALADAMRRALAAPRPVVEDAGFGGAEAAAERIIDALAAMQGERLVQQA